MKLFVVDALHLEARREAKVTFWKRTSAKNVDLGLDWQGWTLCDAVEVDAIVVGKERIMTMSEATRRFIGVKTSNKCKPRLLYANRLRKAYFEVSVYCCCGVNI